MMSEISDQVFSDKKFRDLFESATKQLQEDEGNVAGGGSKRQYKRAIPTAKQSRPEMMLPKTRVTVKMLLSTAQAGNATRTQPLTKTVSDPTIETAQLTANTPGVQEGPVRDSTTEDDAGDEASGRRSKVPRYTYTSTATTEALISRQTNPGLPLFSKNWTSVLPPIINDWGALPSRTPKGKDRGQTSLDFNEWQVSSSP